MLENYMFKRIPATTIYCILHSKKQVNVLLLKL
nr:MAG TPA: hypothetical protein [Caudoviricetes sp.]